MVAPEIQHLLRVTKSSQEVATNFAKYCVSNGIRTSGVKIGRTSRGLRGLVATRSSPAGTTLARVPLSSSISIFEAAKDREFMAKLDPDTAALVYRQDYLKEFVSRTPLRFDQFVVGLFMAHIALTENHKLRPYLDFLPRHEGYFGRLHDKLNACIDGSWMAAACELQFAKQHQLAPSEIRQLVLFALSMVFSRQILLSDTAALSEQFHGAAIPKSLDKNFSTSFLFPVADLVNHSAAYENVDLVVEPTAPHHLVVQATENIAVGDELSVMYSDNMDLLQISWGITSVQ